MGLITATAEAYYGDSDNYGNYQFISLADIVNNFVISYVGEDKIISKIKRTDVAFHAKRCIQELSFDTLPSNKAIEIELPPSLAFILPQDYVNYVNLSWVDEQGIERIIYPTRVTSNPTAPLQDDDGDYTFSGAGDLLTAEESVTLSRFKTANNDVVVESEDRLVDGDLFDLYRYGRRYGLTPEHTQTNGSFYIDQTEGVIRFSSNLVGQIITLKYISDGLGTDDEMQVHKFAEEAIYKYIAHAILSTRANTPEYQIARFKKEARAAKRNAKLRLSNVKIAELAQVMRNQSKWIKH